MALSKNPAVRAIRQRCLECCEKPMEVKACGAKDCPLYPFRMGKNPYINLKPPVNGFKKKNNN